MSVTSDENRNYTVYMHVNKENGKVYIGITSIEPEKRWRKGLGYFNQTHLYNSIKKYGWDNFEHIILFKDRTKEEAENLEILFIKILFSNNNKFGYNISNGGNANGMHSEESKKKISKNRKGLLLGCYNGNSKKVICDGKIFDCLKDCANYYDVKYDRMRWWITGKNKMPQEFIDKDLRYLGDETEFQPQKDLKYGNNPRSKRVVCDDVIYGCITECATHYEVKRKNMSNWLLGTRKMPQKYIDLGLRYATEEDSNTYELVS